MGGVTNIGMGLAPAGAASSTTKMVFPGANSVWGNGFPILSLK